MGATDAILAPARIIPRAGARSAPRDDGGAIPLGVKAASPAASMLPGHMLDGAGTWGHWTRSR